MKTYNIDGIPILRTRPPCWGKRGCNCGPVYYKSHAAYRRAACRAREIEVMLNSRRAKCLHRALCALGMYEYPRFGFLPATKLELAALCNTSKHEG